MKKKYKKYYKSILALIGILALAWISFSVYALVYSYIYEHPLRNLLIGIGVLALLVILGGMSWKKIKWKIKDILT